MEPPQELVVPIVDLGGFFSADSAAAAETIRQIDEACRAHGFFKVVNHGVGAGLVAAAQLGVDEFINMPLAAKQRGQQHYGESYGYNKFFYRRNDLPWKETLSLPFSPPSPRTGRVVQEYAGHALGGGFRHIGEIFQDYAEAMSDLSLHIMELLGLSLGVGREHYRDFFEDHDSTLRIDYFPVCQRPEFSTRTGPNPDPICLTVLHQPEDVDGRQVLFGGKWRTVAPTPDAFVVSIGHAFMKLSNGRYKSCIHRATLNEETERKTLAFCLCPPAGKVVRPPPALVDPGNPQMYPDFKWRPVFHGYRPKHHRTGVSTGRSITVEELSKFFRQPNRD